MNPTTLRIGYRGVKAAWHKFQEFKNDKASEFYDGLLEAGNATQERSDEASEQLSSVLEQSKKRLEKAKAEFGNSAEEVEKRGKKAFKRLSDKADKQTKASRKKAQKAAKKAQAKVSGKKKSSKLKKFGISALLAALVAAIAYAVARFTKQEAETEPPRVEDFGAQAPTESTLVYSSEERIDTAADAAAAADPVEGTPERDEELLKSIDEQIAKHRLKED
ncbi:hypothetical protein [Corynebacterium pseudopelargi]|uniref:Uncharacterized protein n=1 Tax=Corynebacterium pseudopelargi TaxID=2080757 RepID=A0A3G6IRH5_9CORY|nr:hypothetical protein [Corynebacterium pseudopelargi]AZA08175.1 hypothetical protein CPPEL_00115 [Corynebacterium pseudopelargi]